MNQNSIIHIESLSRYFEMGSETVKALQDVTFKINQGEFITIMGTSGSGKTTLLNLLGCLDKPTEGVYLLDKTNVQDLNKNEQAKIRNLKIGFIFQSYNLLPRTSALENVELPLLYNKNISGKERKERAKEALKTVGLEDRVSHSPSQLSGGQQQRVAIARALVNDPVILLADEATGNLDTRTSLEIMTLFQELHSKGKTIAFVTHDVEISAFSNRTIMLRDGRIVKDSIIKNPKNAAEELKKLPKNNDY
jgi:putative ABC transport system ATP-binding protein